jgi:hypothetical protein
MRTVEVVAAHKLGRLRARVAAERLWCELAGVAGAWGVRAQWDGDCARLSCGSGVLLGARGSVEVSDCLVRVVVLLPLPLVGFAGKVRQVVSDRLALELEKEGAGCGS